MDKERRSYMRTQAQGFLSHNEGGLSRDNMNSLCKYILELTEEPITDDQAMDKVGEFLKELTPLTDYYLRKILNIVSGIKYLVNDCKFEGPEFCKRFEIEESQYTNFISGNYNYKTRDLARLNIVIEEYRIMEVKQDEFIQVAKPD
jgi:hypothetical protein